MSHRRKGDAGARTGVQAAQREGAAAQVPAWRKYVGIALIVVVVANLFLAAFRVYGFDTFWIVILAVAALMWLLGFFRSQTRL